MSSIWIGNLGFGFFADWETYANAVTRWAAGGAIYAPQQLSGQYVLPGMVRIGFAYPPASVPLFVPFASQPWGLALWLTLCLAVFVSGLIAIVHRSLGSVGPWTVAALLTGLALFPPFGSNVATGNANLLIVGIFAWMWPGNRSPFAVGLSSAIGAILKIYPGMISVWAIRGTGLRAIGIAVASVVALVLATLPLVGMHSWHDFAVAMSNSVPYCSGRVSVACVAEPYVGASAAKLVGIVVALPLLGASLGVSNGPWSYALLALAMLAPVSDLHFYYLLIAYPVGIALIVDIVARRRERTAMASRPGMT